MTGVPKTVPQPKKSPEITPESPQSKLQQMVSEEAEKTNQFILETLRNINSIFKGKIEPFLKPQEAINSNTSKLEPYWFSEEEVCDKFSVYRHCSDIKEHCIENLKHDTLLLVPSNVIDYAFSDNVWSCRASVGHL